MSGEDDTALDGHECGPTVLGPDLRQTVADLRAEVARLTADLSALQQAMHVEFAGEESGDLLADFGVFLDHHKAKESTLARLRQQQWDLITKWRRQAEVRLNDQRDGGYVSGFDQAKHQCADELAALSGK